ncbi:MAG: prolipoprotein diacylglyceryl transferase [Lachnospiraceae bacterium]|nr:prolipoprotein diacylglyceryl transferase [Lachnospiraceae bacterium]
MDIAFPNLGIYLEKVPKSISIFGMEIMLYGIIIATGILVGLILASHEAKRVGLKQEILWDFALYVIPVSVIGARLYYVIFRWDYFRDDLLRIFDIRSGGMAIYGSVIAAVTVLIIFCRRKRISPFVLGDAAVPSLLTGQTIGRWGNFTNREAFGNYTDGLLAMRLPIAAVRESEITEQMAVHITEGVNYIQVHPTFLYESLWNLVLLLGLWLYRKRKRFDGELILLYFAGYGLGRAWIEGLRTDQLLLPGSNLAVSQLLSVVLFVAAVGADVVFRLRKSSKTK